MVYSKYAPYLLRIGVASAFFYPPVAAYLNPDNWIWFVPDFVALFISKELFLNLFGIVELIIAFGLLFLKNPTIPALAASGLLVSIIVLDWQAFDVVFRDIAILLSALAIVALYYDKAKGIMTLK
jgi:hypothetical protein